MPDQGSVGFPAADPGAVEFDQIGDAGLLVSFASTDDAAAALAQAVAAAIESARAAAPAMGRPVPAQASVLIPFDPLAISLEDAIGIARSAVAAAEAAPAFAGRDAADAATPAIEVPVRYGGKDGPDLATVAELHGLRPADVVELHATVRYRVLFLGFAPGFGYLVGLPAALATPRRDRPRERVPAGSIGIAGEQTAIYPLAMPGGWHLIGRTDAILFDPDRPEPALLRPGSTVRFVPVADR